MPLQKACQASESLRQAVSSLYTTLKAEDIQITSGASEALFLLTGFVMEPGANIVVEEPCYENLPGVARALGFEVRRLPSSPIWKRSRPLRGATGTAIVPPRRRAVGCKGPEFPKTRHLLRDSDQCC
ncbi:MAG: aminotransferase class I/II-fold pyridoxal phosphate-dependent enzyme [Ktedonobacteraceae bacterium]